MEQFIMKANLEEVINTVLEADKLENTATIIANIQPVDGEKNSAVLYVNGDGEKANHLLIHIFEQILKQMTPLQKMIFLMQVREYVGGKTDDHENN